MMIKILTLLLLTFNAYASMSFNFNSKINYNVISKGKLFTHEGFFAADTKQEIGNDTEVVLSLTNPYLFTSAFRLNIITGYKVNIDEGMADSFCKRIGGENASVVIFQSREINTNELVVTFVDGQVVLGKSSELSLKFHIAPIAKVLSGIVCSK